MSVELRSSKKHILLVSEVNHQIRGSKLPSNLQVLAVLFFNIHSSLDRCQLSIRDSVYIFKATVEALGLSCDDYPTNKSSIHVIRTQMSKDRAESIKPDFHNNVPEVVTVH